MLFELHAEEDDARHEGLSPEEVAASRESVDDEERDDDDQDEPVEDDLSDAALAALVEAERARVARIKGGDGA